MRTKIAIAAVIFAMPAWAQTADVAPDALLERGREHYRAGRFAEAVSDLNAATQAYLSGPELQTYVSTGRFEKLPQIETSLVYLALSHEKLGNEAAAREAVLRLFSAERIEPTFQQLNLPERPAFERLAARLVPEMNLREPVQIAGQQPPSPAPTPVPAAPAPAPAPSPAVPVRSAEERLRVVETLLAEECARVRREADEQIAAIQREADARVAAADAAAARRIAEIEQAAQQRIAAAERARREAERQVAEAPRPLPEPRPQPQPAEPAPLPQPPAPQPLPQPAEVRPAGEWSAALERADGLAAAGRLDEAAQIYARVASSGASRELRGRGAAGLYQVRAYRGAVDAFEKLAPFARGEEDLRYYYAVSLFETGRYAEAQHELACALPFIQQTDEVLRTRTKIEQMLAWRHAQSAEGSAQ